MRIIFDHKYFIFTLIIFFPLFNYPIYSHPVNLNNITSASETESKASGPEAPDASSKILNFLKRFSGQYYRNDWNFDNFFKFDKSKTKNISEDHGDSFTAKFLNWFEIFFNNTSEHNHDQKKREYNNAKKATGNSIGK